MDRHRPLRPRALYLLACLAFAGMTAATPQEEVEEEYVDFSQFMTPTCELTGLLSVPPDGWFNVSVQNPPAGHRGCQMMRTNDEDELVGLMRLRSLDAAALEFADEDYEAFVGNEFAVLGSMGYVIGEPIWAREDVPVAGDGFSPARAVGLQVSLEDGAPHEIHLLIFRNAEAKYLLVLATPTKAYDAAIYQANQASFATMITTLQRPAE